MNVIDIVLGVFIIVLAIRGLIRGLIKEIFGLAALIGGVVLSDMFGKQFGNVIYHHLTVSPFVAYVSSFFIIFIVVYLGFLLIGYVLSNIIKAIQLGWLDRTFGFAFGALKAFLLIAVFVFVVKNFPFFGYLNRDLEKNSYIYTEASRFLSRLDIQKFINRARTFKNKKINGLTIEIGGYNAQG